MLAGVVRAASRSTSMPLRRSIASQVRYSSTSPVPTEESHSSTTSSTEENSSSPQVYLTPERKRKLIKIYHQAENFVTPENLSQYLDQEFRRGLRGGKDHRDEDHRGLVIEELYERRSLRKTSSLSVGEEEGLRKFPTTLGETRRQKRDRRVRAALFGLDDSEAFEPKAGVETVEEKWNNVPDALKE